MSSAIGLGAQNWKCYLIVYGNKAQLSCPLGSKRSSVIPEGVTQAPYSICGLLGANWLSGTLAICRQANMHQVPLPGPWDG